MRKTLTIALLVLPAVGMAQTNTVSGSSNSSSTTSALGNSQAITFMSSAPSEVTTHANINSTSNSTSNIISSGTTTSIVDYRGEYTIKNVPSVSGPPLTTSNDTCMGSSSAGANVPGLGVSFGTTWTDEHCKRLKMSRELWNKGMKAASLAMDCMDSGAKLALEMTGTKCPQSMTVEERRAAFGMYATDVGAAPSPAFKPLVLAAPVASVKAFVAPMSVGVAVVDNNPVDRFAAGEMVRESVELPPEESQLN